MGVDQLDWTALADAAANCQACGLCAGRKHSTLQAPETQQQADWFFVGDPPDEDEDQMGHAFAGPAGQLLDNMFKAMGARRGEAGRGGAYATNIVKCRPPVARVPQADDVAQCAGYLQRELALVRPKVIVAMGRLATAHLLGEHPEALVLPLGKQRGTVYRYQGIPVVVTYAPKILLRASADKAKAWADLCLALDVRDGLV
jgi:uracil-DNA glycosylase family 4